MLDQFVARTRERGGALVVRGDAGIGKTALLAAATAAASSKSVSVLRAAGAQSEMGLAFAGLHQLLRPMLTRLERLPGPQRDALSAAFGVLDVPAPDPFLISLAALNLLADAAEHAPLLLVVDDPQWLLQQRFRPIPQRATQPGIDRHAKAHLRPVDQRARHIAIENPAQLTSLPNNNDVALDLVSWGAGRKS